MKPNVELHIEELVLHGFNPADRYRIGEAVERELARLLTVEGIGDGLCAGHFPVLEEGSFRMSIVNGSETLGVDIAASIYRSFRTSSARGAKP